MKSEYDLEDNVGGVPYLFGLLDAVKWPFGSFGVRNSYVLLVVC